MLATETKRERAREAQRRYLQSDRGKAMQRARQQSETYKATARARYETRKQKLDDIKLASGCVDCGYNDHPAALDFDHVRGDKKYNVGHIVSGSWDKIAEEIAKCEVRCANCHRIKTVEERR